MIFGKVCGSVVATQRADGMSGARYLLVEACSYRGEGKQSYHVALDLMGAGPGELVLLSQGSSCRQTESTKDKPVDAMIIGIIDEIEAGGESAFKK